MIPTRRFLWLTGGLSLLGLLPFWFPSLGIAWLGTAAAFGLIALADLLLRFRRPVSAVRELRTSMSLDRWSEVTIAVDNRSGSDALSLAIFDHFPDGLRTEGLPIRLRVGAGQRGEATYRVRPVERGLKVFPRIDVRLASPLGLWWRTRRIESRSEVRVYPNYSTITKLLAYEVDSHLQLAGLRLRQRRGEGIEFHQLRDYRDGDSIRSIDWKATARVGRLIAREHQDERDQQIVCLLDTGRRMLAKDASLSHFDHCLNAMLLLCFMALRHGDAAGVLTMGPRASWLPPRKGANAINGILNHVYDLQPDRIEIDYLAAVTELAMRQRRRSLVVILTNVREEDSEELLRAVQLISRKHLVMIASLRERVLDDTLAAPVSSLPDALSWATTQRYLDTRRESQRLLSASGVYVEDCLCDELPAAITNRYLAIKRAGLL